MKQIKTGVLGYGFSGKVFQCPFIEANEAFELTAVVQRHGETAKEDYPKILLYRDYKDMLGNPEIELIVVSTPAHLHFEHAMLALNHHKHVLIEKPFAATYKEAQQLVALAEEKGLVVCAYQNRRYDGDFLTVKALLEDPTVRLYEFEAVWDRFVPKIMKDWHEAGFKGADLLFDLGPHYLDQALALFGVPESWHGTAKKLREGSEIIDYFAIELNYPESVIHLKSTLIAAKPDIRYKVHTNKGTYHFYEMGEQEHQLIGGMKPDDPAYGDNAFYDFYDYEGVKTSHQVVKGSYMAFFTKLAEAIRYGSPPPVTTEATLRVIRMLESMV